MAKAIIFDWSGTLVDDMPPVLEATNAVFRSCGRPTMDRDTYRREFCLPYTRFYERHAPGLTHDALEDTFRAAFVNSTAPVTLLPYAERFLQHSKSLGHQHIVLSSALPEAVQAQAVKFGVDRYLDVIYAGVVDKRAFIGPMLERHGLHPENTLYVGDMVHDIETAHHADIKAVALLTGYDYAGVLEAAEPDLLLEDLSQLIVPLVIWHHSGILTKRGSEVRSLDYA
jgi:phosphoglycolate phosphatase